MPQLVHESISLSVYQFIRSNLICAQSLRTCKRHSAWRAWSWETCCCSARSARLCPFSCSKLGPLLQRPEGGVCKDLMRSACGSSGRPLGGGELFSFLTAFRDSDPFLSLCFAWFPFRARSSGRWGLLAASWGRRWHVCWRSKETGLETRDWGFHCTSFILQRRSFGASFTQVLCEEAGTRASAAESRCPGHVGKLCPRYALMQLSVLFLAAAALDLCTALSWYCVAMRDAIRGCAWLAKPTRFDVLRPAAAGE